MYDEKVLEVFLKEQGKLFDEPVASNMEEAEEFLDDCMAVVLNSIKEVREYFEENMDISDDMSDDDLEEELEVFKIPDGRYLVVEA